MTAVARPAATVVLIRPDRSVLLIQRNRTMAFFGGAFAFPGGRIEATDLGPSIVHPWKGHQVPVAGSDFTASLDALYGAYVCGGVREVKEETGITLAYRSLVLWARWITPELEQKRYDTLFFLAPVDADADVQVDGGETVSHCWLTPEAALAAMEKKELFLPPPTRMTLRELSEMPSREAMLATRPLPEIMPILQPDGDALYLVLPGDPLHPQPASRPWPVGVQTRMKIEMP